MTSTPDRSIELGCRVDGALGIITFARPEKRNAMTRAMWEALPGCMAELQADPRVRCIVFTGGQHDFGAGADLHDVYAASASPAAAHAYSGMVVRTLSTVARST